MTFRRFLDISYTLLFEEYQRLGTNLIEALELVERWRSGSTPKPTGLAKTESSAEVSVVRQNEDSLKQFESMMQGVVRT